MEEHVPATSDRTQPADPTDAGSADPNTAAPAPPADPIGNAAGSPARRRRFGPAVAGPAVAGLAAALACLACLLPLLAAGGLAGGLAAAVTDANLILVTLAGAGVVAAGVWVSRHRNAKAGSCDCGGGTGC
jgi:hypothetical protein